MRIKMLSIALFFITAATALAEPVSVLIRQAMSGLVVKSSETPYSRTIEKMLIGYDTNGSARVGIAQREIKSFKPITGVVIIHRTEDGFVLHEAHFPNISKIKKAKDRQQVQTILKSFKNIPFDPHAEKSAVDGLTGATRYGIQTSGYLNYLARRTAREMEAAPDWDIVNTL